MKDKKLCGIMPALMTAFNETGVDTAKVTALTKHLADEGVHGLYVGGSSGEMILMTQEERKVLLETVMDSVGDRLTVIAHVGTTSTAGSLELARHAEQCGAHAVSSVTPLYYKYGFREVKHYYERLAAETSPEILSIPNVGGMKFTASDFFQLERIRSAFPDKVFYNGSDEMLLSGLAAGADGGIGTTYNVQPKTILSVYNAYMRNDARGALKYQSTANAVIAEVLKYGVLPSCKLLLKLNGMDYGECREPFMPLSEEAAAALSALKPE